MFVLYSCLFLLLVLLAGSFLYIGVLCLLGLVIVFLDCQVLCIAFLGC